MRDRYPEAEHCKKCRGYQCHYCSRLADNRGLTTFNMPRKVKGQKKHKNYYHLICPSCQE